MVFLNLLLLVLGWGLLFQKKQVALAIPLIVIKYAISGFIIYQSLRLPWLDPVWFIVGLTSFIVTPLIYVQRHNGI